MKTVSALLCLRKKCCYVLRNTSFTNRDRLSVNNNQQYRKCLSDTRNETRSVFENTESNENDIDDIRPYANVNDLIFSDEINFSLFLTNVAKALKYDQFTLLRPRPE